ncbi:MAG: fused MFS/spermidine synthase [Planctomycetota bacterium]
MILLAAGLAGFAVLTLEVLGVHRLAPWFGTSTLVWCNQIGVILAAMAVGGWLGGRRARTTPGAVRDAGRLLFWSGLLIAAGLLLLPALAGFVLPSGQFRLEEAAGIFLSGSLAAALILFAPPVLLLAMVAPLLVEARSQARGAGRAAGEVSAAGTLGSLAGVFGTTLVAIPFLGTRLTLAGTALLLVAAGLLLLRPVRALSLAALGAALVPGFLSEPADEANLPFFQGRETARVLETRETPYQHLRVVGFPSGDRWLQMNEGLDSYQSIWKEGGGWPGGYYDLFVLAPIYALDGGPAENTVRFWLLGSAAGSSLIPVAAGLSGRPWEGVGVEIDPGVVDLARRWMPLPARLAGNVRYLTGVDARSSLRGAPRNLDFILLDAYARQFEIPLHLATEEFFREVWNHLRPGGVFGLNVGTREKPGERFGFLGRLRATLAAVFGKRLRAHRVPYSRNVIVFARRERPFPSLEALAGRLPPGIPVEVGSACLPSRVIEGSSGLAGEMVFTDDRNPLALEQARLWLGGKTE